MVNSTPPSKISKITAIQLIDEQIDQFSVLLDAVLPAGATAVDSSKRILSTLRQTVTLICQLTSEDDARDFIKSILFNLSCRTKAETFKAAALHDYINDLFDKDPDKFDSIFNDKVLSYCRRNVHWYDVSLFASLFIDGFDTHTNVRDKWGKKVARESIAGLKLYRRKIIQTWDDDTKHPFTFQVDQIGEFVMQGNSYRIGDITDSNLSGFVIGEHNTVVASLNAAGRPELAQALTTLTQAVLASHDLPEDKKEEQVKVINQIGKEAAEPKPNKTLLKILVDGLLATLKAVPDVANAVTVAAPLLSQLHL